MPIDSCMFFVGSIARAFSQGRGPIQLNQLQCVGSEARLVDCPSGATTGCTHAHDVGVRCHVQTGIQHPPPFLPCIQARFLCIGYTMRP